MNNYYPYGYSPYPGQPPAQQPYTYPTAPPFPAPAPPYPQHTNNAFDARSHVQDSFEQNQNMIPGLGYGHLPQGFGWQQPQQPAPQAPPQQWQPPREGPNLIPASQYYQSDDAPKAQAAVGTGAPPPAAPKRPTKQSTGDAEEGELSDGELDDVYEPQETVIDTTKRQPGGRFQVAATANNRNGNTNAGAAASKWYGGPRDGGVETPVASDGAGRERSGSYSPHLSPREVNPLNTTNNQQSTPQQTPSFNGQVSQPSVAGLGQQVGRNAVEDARQRAQAAILNLWPLGVRHQDYVDEGIDKSVVKDLFTELKLDTDTPSQSAAPGAPASTPLPGLSHSYGQSSAQTTNTPTAAPSKPPAQDQTSPTVAKSAGEERKDRIARLLAAKGAKPASSAPTTGSQVEAKGSAQATSHNDKEVVLQQKMDALQKSREARAQKAAERKGSLQASQSKEASPTTVSQTPSSTAGAPAASQSAPQAASASSIPGLFLSSPQPVSVNNHRKRPVAADFVASSHVNKRPFGHNYQDRPFVIDVSDASDDEDVEMEIGSPTDEPTNIHQTDASSRKTASFRDFPPLSENRPQRQLSSPAPSNVTTPQSGVGGAQPKQAHLEVMDKQIEAMKRKIALAEARRKLKAAMNSQSVGQKSNGETPEAAVVVDSDASKPAMRRVQSMGASSASDQPNGQSSPAVAEPSSSMRLPKPSEKQVEGDSSRIQKLRVVSTNLPLVENRLQAKKSKLRLLQFQMTRLEKEIEEEMAEKQKLAEEMEKLNQDSYDESVEPQNQLKSNSVDPVITQSSAGPESEVQALLPATETIASNQTTTEAAALNPAAVDTQKSQPPVMEHDQNAHTTPIDDAVTGKAATSPLEAPVPTDNAISAFPQVPVNQEPVDDEVEESQQSASDDASDVVMGESDDSSSLEQEREPSTDTYEPPETVAPAVASKSPSISPVAADSTVSLANSDTDLQQSSSRASPVAEQISLGVNESTPEQGVDAVREVPPAADEISSGDRFIPYESPLQYFRAYRYHPKFAETVPGGLRSLTYSNRIDPNLPLCPDQLASRDCPRGADCIYQHFESMKLPDDQILLQLGGTTLEGAERAQFNDGLRKLLQEMRSQNIKDFPSIAQGIVDYHNRFTGDPSKILPLGSVSI